MMKVVLLLFHNSVQLLLFTSLFEFDLKNSSLDSLESSGSKLVFTVMHHVTKLLRARFKEGQN